MNKYFRFIRQYIGQRTQYFFFQRILRINGNIWWSVHWSSIVGEPENISFPTNTLRTSRIGYMPSQYVNAKNKIIIGQNVLFAMGVKLISANHNLYDYKKYAKNDPIIICDDCWVGVNAVILPGVRLGRHTIVGANSVVTKSFIEGFQIIAGNPAKTIKKLEPDNHLRWSDTIIVKSNTEQIGKKISNSEGKEK